MVQIREHNILRTSRDSLAVICCPASLLIKGYNGFTLCDNSAFPLLLCLLLIWARHLVKMAQTQ